MFVKLKPFKDYFQIYEDVNQSKFRILPEGSSLPSSGVVKVGFDPTGVDLHLGHLIVLNMVKKLKNNGMEAHVILGTFTAMLGDPSGRDATRPMLSASATKANADAIISQLHRVLGNDITIHYNHEWFNKMTMPEMLAILSKYTVNFLLSRDAFQKRMESGSTIGMHELIVPILQGLDSVELQAAVEVGGTDQLFNFMLSREVQVKAGQTPEICVMAPVINGIDGRKMSKSFNNCIFLNDSPKEVYWKAMQVTDDVMYQWYPILTDGYDEKLHPIELKKRLAIVITDMIWGPGEGDKQRAAHDSVAAGSLPTDIPEIEKSPIVDFVATLNGLSKGNARKLIQGGGVTVAKSGTQELSKVGIDFELNQGDVLKAGKKNWAKVK